MGYPKDRRLEAYEQRGYGGGSPPPGGDGREAMKYPLPIHSLLRDIAQFMEQLPKP